jgi:hypothetical protein
MKFFPDLETRLFSKILNLHRVEIANMEKKKKGLARVTTISVVGTVIFIFGLIFLIIGVTPIYVDGSTYGATTPNLINFGMVFFLVGITLWVAAFRIGKKSRKKNPT